MTQRHMDRLTSFDTSFLANERHNAHMAIGAVLDLRGLGSQPRGLPRPYTQPPAPAAALAPAPRLPAAVAGRPFWVDDPDFDIAEHVRP